MMQAILFTVLFPVLPCVLWCSYNKEKQVKREEMVLRYFLYMLLISFISAAALAVFSDEDTSFLEKMDRSAGFVLKYAVMELAAALLVAFVEWNLVKKKRLVRVDWEQLGTWKPAVLCRRYLCPVLPYLLAVLAVGLNVGLIFDNVVWGDEAFSVGTAEASMGGILQIMYYWDNHPPLYYYWLKLFGELFGFSVPVCHLASIVPFAGGILLALFLFRKRFGNIPAAFFIVISGMGAACLEYNLEIRMYALAFFCLAACFYCSYRVLGTGRKSAWAGMVLWGLAGAYSHYYALVAGGLILFFTGAAVWVRDRKRTWLKGAGAILAFLLGYSPWMFFLFTAMRNVSGNWWVTEILGLDEALDMVFGSTGMIKVIVPLLVVLCAFIFLADSGVLRVVKQKEELFAEVHAPGMKSWTAETYSTAVGLFTIAGTVGFGYFLCCIMTPVLVQRYLYPVSAVTFCVLVVAGGRGLALLGQLGEKTGCSHLKGAGKAVMVYLICVLLVKGLGNYRDYSGLVWQQNEKTEETLTIIGAPDKDVNLVTDGVRHLGWTVLSHYYPDNEIVNGGYRESGSDRFWYFSPHELGEDTLDEIAESGISVTAYGQKQISQYPFYLYYMETVQSRANPDENVR